MNKWYALDDGIEIPERKTEHSAGYDLKALETLELMPGQRALVGTGLTIQLSPMRELQIRPRSGLAWGDGVTVLNTPGTIDRDYYPNEIKVLLINHGGSKARIEAGDRIAQGVICVYDIAENDVCGGKRSGGFGSTGR